MRNRNEVMVPVLLRRYLLSNSWCPVVAIHVNGLGFGGAEDLA
jgi:hypothetical protein